MYVYCGGEKREEEERREERKRREGSERNKGKRGIEKGLKKNRPSLLFSPLLFSSLLGFQPTSHANQRWFLH